MSELSGVEPVREADVRYGDTVAENRPAVPQRMKRVLIEQVGGKCANPGCPNRLLELHHIREWAVYRTHDEAHMIALCPSCHDSVDRGTLTITDDELYQWKGIERSKSAFTGSIFIEPAAAPSIRFGSITLKGPEGVTLFKFASQKLAFAVREDELLVLNLKLADATGNIVVDVVDNYIRQRDSGITIESRSGRWRVRGKIEDLFPKWAIACLMSRCSTYPVQRLDTEIDLLDIAVQAPGRLSVNGAWIDDRFGVLADRESGFITFLSRESGTTVGLKGAQDGETVMNFLGDIDQSVFDVTGG
ncbi:HNH endonuclease signature motif containing protein [Streptomyces sp. NPDC057757]|uniref:HNH endonuclease signature motif containing protein n=1 Tax=Streptomyces sp. NPDC057757 TaxID=3346241 RepID=UPI0036A23F07